MSDIFRLQWIKKAKTIPFHPNSIKVECLYCSSQLKIANQINCSKAEGELYYCNRDTYKAVAVSCIVALSKYTHIHSWHSLLRTRLEIQSLRRNTIMMPWTSPLRLVFTPIYVCADVIIIDVKSTSNTWFSRSTIEIRFRLFVATLFCF